MDDSYLAKGWSRATWIPSPRMTLDLCRQYVRPYAQFILTKGKMTLGQKYVWIQIQEFDEFPGHCKKSHFEHLEWRQNVYAQEAAL